MDLLSNSMPTLSTPVDTIYIGGGTPSLLSGKDLSSTISKGKELAARLSELVSPDTHFAPVKEITVEANPESLSLEFIDAFMESGGNRLSLGVQDMSERGLKTLGRIHSVDQVGAACEMARRAGVWNLGMDIIYGIVGQDREWLNNTLDAVLGLHPDHLSCYELTVEEGTSLHRQIRSGKFSQLSQDQAVELMDLVETKLVSSGFDHYEISNFSRPGKQSRHNINYWLAGEYVGVGIGAHSHIAGIRRANTMEMSLYFRSLQQERLPVAEIERLDEEARFREAFVMGMRLVNGLSLEWFQERFSVDPVEYYGDMLKQFAEFGHLHIEDGRIALTKRGRRLFNSVMCHFI